MTSPASSDDPAASRAGERTAGWLEDVPIFPLGTVLFPLIGLFGGGGFFGWAKPVPVNVGRLRRQRSDYVLVAAAGPASNMLIALVAAAVLALMPGATVMSEAVRVVEPLRQFLWVAMSLNVMLAVLNMLPIPPLDGGTVLGGLLPGALARRFDALRPYGFLILLVLMVRGGFSVLVGTPVNFILSWLQ